tara:strand:+ start:37 stop:939 length:903 start_codon:yes stop_codon:yes gene_type:complete
MNKSNNKSNLSAWIFVLLSCAFIISIAYNNKSNELETIANTDNQIIDSKNNLNNEDDFNEIDLAYDNDNELDVEQKIDVEQEIDEDIVIKENIAEQKNNENDIYVNKIIISKNIDDDKNSDTYRNPIDAFKTISTLDESVVKEINYYPTLFVWSSVNTENVSLVNDEEKFNPINLSMTLKCKDKLIDKLEYSVTANTPRWREWIEINLEEVDEDMLNEFWNVEIVDNSNNNILESRNFKLLDYNTVLEQVNIDAKQVIDLADEKDLNLDSKIIKNKSKNSKWNEEELNVEEIDAYNLNNR